MDGLTLERLGVDPNGQAAVWVAWIEAPEILGALAQLAPGFVCPECLEPVDLARPRGVLACVEETPHCRSVSDRCTRCQARLHFDNTPAEARAGLRWPQVAIGAQPLARSPHVPPAIADALEQTRRETT